MTRPSTNYRDRHGEAGYALLFTAVLMIGMMLFLALVIDVGQVMLHRRQDQAAARKPVERILEQELKHDSARLNASCHK